MKFKYLVISDIHLGHHINKTNKIIENLDKFFLDYSKVIKDINAIFLAGDIFDRLLNSSSQEFILINDWITRIVKFTKEKKIMLRILEGTHSHDWNQAKVVTSILEQLNIEIDYKYIDTIYIEKNKKYDVNILYIPDDYNPDSKVTYQQVQKVLKENHLQEVDIAIMHGAFHYQLPGVTLLSSHTESDYLDIVKHYINIGHIHKHTINGKILAQGSFDRLAHGEEEDKGAIVVTIDTNKENNFIFLKNKYAMVFKTIDLEDKFMEETITYLDKELKKYKDGSSIRLISNKLEINIETIRKRYSNLLFKLETKKEKENKYKILEQDLILEEFTITKDNIKELLDKEIEPYKWSEEYMKIYSDTIEKFR